MHVGGIRSLYGVGGDDRHNGLHLEIPYSRRAAPSCPSSEGARRGAVGQAESTQGSGVVTRYQ